MRSQPVRAADPDIGQLCRAVDITLAFNPIRPEEVLNRAQLLEPLEKAASALAVKPGVPDTEGGRIGLALWYAAHPEEADLRELLEWLRDSSPMVRFCAVEALAASIKSGAELWAQPQFALEARQVLSQCGLADDSPLVSRGLKDLESAAAKLLRPRRKSRQKVVANPYVAGPPVQDEKSFFGRDDVLSKIKALLNQRSSIRGVVLYGARRTGKTSLLYRIRNGDLGKSIIPVYLDMQGCAGAPLGAFLQVLLRLASTAVAEARPAAELPPAPTGDLDFFQAREHIDALLDAAGNDCLLLLFDEFELLGSYLGQGLADHFQSLLESRLNLFIIFAGARKLESVRAEGFGKLMDLTRYMKISFLAPDEALRLIREPAAGILEFEEGSPERILELTDGHPFYTQLLCQGVFEVMQTHRGEPVQPEHIEEAVLRFLENPPPHLILTWNELKLEEEIVASTLARLQCAATPYVSAIDIARRLKAEQFPAPLKASEVEPGLSSLREIEWVEKRANQYRFSMELVRRWVAENRSLSDLAGKYREYVVARVPTFARQRLAWILDFVILCGIVWIVQAAGATGAGLALSLTGIPFLYFAIPLLTRCSTPAMRLSHIRVIASSAHRLARWRALEYALLLTVRFRIGWQLLFSLFALFADFSPATLLFCLLLATPEALDTVLILFGKRRQGLYEKFARALLAHLEVFEE